MNNYCIVFDFETDNLPEKPKPENICKDILENKKPEKALTNYIDNDFGRFHSVNPVQLAAVAIDLRNCTIEKSSEFNLIICPDELKTNKNYYEDHKKTIDFHIRQGTYGKSKSQALKKWKEGYGEKDAWLEFLRYCKEFKTGSSYENLPIAGGQNIIDFDLPIIQKLKSKFGGAYPFRLREKFDLLNFSIPWMMFSSNPPPNYKQETIAKRLGVKYQGKAHEALADVLVCAEIFCKFLKLHKELGKRIKDFK